MPTNWGPVSNSVTEVSITDGFNNADLASGVIPSGSTGLVVYVANPLTVSTSGITILGQIGISGVVDVSGQVGVSNFPNPLTVNGTVGISGIPTVNVNSMPEVIVSVSGLVIESGIVIANQGSPAPLASGWPIKITDGVNVLGVVSHPVIVSGLVDEIQLPYISGVLTVTSDAPVVFQIPPGYQTLYLNNFTFSGRLDAYLDSLGNNQIPSYVHDGGTGLTQGYPLFIPLERVYDLNTFDNSIIPVGGLSELFFFDSNTDTCNFLLSPQKFNATSDFYLEFLFNWLTNTLSPLPKIDINTMPNVIVSGVTTVNQGSPTTVASGWPVKITDGTNVLGTATNPIVTSGTYINRIIQPIAISGVPAVSVSNFPNPITVNGSVTLSGAPVVTVSGTVNADIINFPASQNVVVTAMPNPVTVNGSVTISGTLPNVTINNLPLPVNLIPSGNINVAVQSLPSPISVNGAVSISGTLPTGTNTIGSVKLTDGTNIALIDSNGNVKVDVSGWFNSGAPTVGSKTSANSIPVVIASDQAAVTVAGTVTATMPSPLTVNGAVSVSGTLPNVTINSLPLPVNLIPSGNINVAIVSAPTPETVNGSINVSGWLGSAAPTIGTKGMASSLPVTLASDQVGITGSGILVNQGAPNALASGWPVKITDGTNTLGTSSNPIFTSDTVTSLPSPVTVNGTIAVSGNYVVSTSAVAPSGYTNLGIISVQVYPSTATRKGMVVQNISTGNNIVYLGLGSTAVSGFGITLYPQGGTYSMDEMTFTNAAINALSTPSGASLSFQEFK